METTPHITRQGVYQTGLAAACLSLGIFWAGIYEEKLFVLNIVITLGYFITIWSAGKLRKGNDRIHYVLLFLVIFLISAFALNRPMNIFQESANWFSVLLAVSCINITGFALFNKMPLWLRHLMCAVLGVSLLAFLYLTIYLVPLWPVSLVISFLLGISLHTFLPLMFFIYVLLLISKVSRPQPIFKKSFLCGIFAGLVAVFIFCTEWKAAVNQITNDYKADNKEGLPAWVVVDRSLQRNEMTATVLKSELLYTVFSSKHIFNMFSVFGLGSGGPKKHHDPLVMIASCFFGIPDIPEQDRQRLLASYAFNKHETQERLWAGDDLETSFVKTVATIWPSMRLAYAEKTITVSNKPRQDRSVWSNQQEAIYTFYLPEGAVVSSLSLWVNGREEKGVLTTKEKAATAYRTIVGVQKRDPSLVQWQEGNTVSVRVFPVFTNESRMFKIGVSMPLATAEGQLIYDDMVFRGPATTSTEEELDLIVKEPAQAFATPAAFAEKGNGTYSYKGKYKPGQSFSWKDAGMRPASFSFNNETYTIKPYAKMRAMASIGRVYLDINEHWTKYDLATVLKMMAGKQVMTDFGGFKIINTSNEDMLYEALRKRRYGIFPFHKIANDTGALVITKGSTHSVALDELKGTPFYTGLQTWAAGGCKIKLFNLGYETGLYERSLREMRLLDYEQGDLGDLKDLVTHGYFAASAENDAQVVLHDAALSITKTVASAEPPLPAGPDHIMRLFAYNHIMQKGGASFFDGGMPDSSELVTEASMANIVTPVSSLVVLETAEDYDRFDIKKTNNGLQNATAGGKGSVPEPHEWALIIIGILLLLYFRQKQIRSFIWK